jgi:hypothetical protein
MVATKAPPPPISTVFQRWRTHQDRIDM